MLVADGNTLKMPEQPAADTGLRNAYAFAESELGGVFAYMSLYGMEFDFMPLYRFEVSCLHRFFPMQQLLIMLQVKKTASIFRKFFYFFMQNIKKVIAFFGKVEPLQK